MEFGLYSLLQSVWAHGAGWAVPVPCHGSPYCLWTSSPLLRTDLTPKARLTLTHGETLCQEQRHRKSLFLRKDLAEIEGKLSSLGCFAGCKLFLGSERGVSVLPERSSLFVATISIKQVQARFGLAGFQLVLSLLILSARVLSLHGS